MSSVAITVIEKGLDQAAAAIARLTDPDKHELMDVVGRMIQLQTRQRLASDKTAPDGTPWQDNYSKSSTLYASGTLHDSIDYHSTSDEVVIGSPLIYAAIHHFGGVIKPKNGKALAFSSGGKSYVVKSVTIPARPYLGLSVNNRDEIESIVAEFIGQVLQ
ncbi:hypothetical protein JI58_00505 [Marinosulfonomonas sp. PRT-SC04]|nr:hypothetical protein JI58_00505 [Marinosulfonomonas sp. PRT-SC04]